MDTATTSLGMGGGGLGGGAAMGTGGFGGGGDRRGGDDGILGGRGAKVNEVAEEMVVEAEVETVTLMVAK